jgi:hypothetical protein
MAEEFLNEDFIEQENPYNDFDINCEEQYLSMLDQQSDGLLLGEEAPPIDDNDVRFQA